MIKKLKHIGFDNIAISIIAAVSISIAVYNFFDNREINGDESMLACNIIDRNFLELLKPLDYMQVGPILFLYAEKIGSLIIPNTEHGFRIFPLLCFIFSFFFLYKTTKLLNFNTIIQMTVFGLYGFNLILLIYGSVQGKQYMSDVLVLLIMYYLTLKPFLNPQNRFWALAIAGSISVFLSNIAPVILLTCGCSLFYRELTLNKKIWLPEHKPYLYVFGSWLVSFGIYYVFFVHDHPAHEYMCDFWKDAFLPLDSFRNAYDFVIGRLSVLLITILPASIPFYARMLLLFIGFIVIICRKQYQLLIMSTVPVLVHFVLSAFKLYPIEIRLTTYLFVPLIFIIAYGTGTIISLLKKLSKTVASIVSCSFCAYLLYFLLFRLMPGVEESKIREAFMYIDKKINNSENVYINFGLTTRYRFYEKTGKLTEIPKHHIIEGNWTSSFYMRNNNINKNGNGNISEIDCLEGKTWLIIAGKENRINVLQRLDLTGFTKLDSLPDFICDSGMYGYLIQSK